MMSGSRPVRRCTPVSYTHLIGARRVRRRGRGLLIGGPRAVYTAICRRKIGQRRFKRQRARVVRRAVSTVRIAAGLRISGGHQRQIVDL